MIARPFILLLMALSITACSTDGIEKKEKGPILPKSSYSSAEERKLAFFQKLHPIVKKENQRIEDEREFLISALKKASKGSLKDSEKKELKEIARKYRVSLPKAFSKDGIEELERKVGSIPPRLAMIQAANESNWGRSRFARQGNNLFGQWCFTKGCGIVPERRAAGAKHEVASFSSIAMSVRGYLLNLNSHPAYKSLRDIRAKARKNGKALDAHEMAAGLRHYAGIGDEYVRILRKMMKDNEALLQQAIK